MGDSAGARGLFCVDPDTSPFGSEDATPGSRACVCACSSWPVRAGQPPRRVLVRLIVSCGRLILLLCSAPLRAGVARTSGVFLFFLFSFLCPLSALPPSRAPAVSGLLCFPALGALGLGALCFCSVPPPPVPLFFWAFPPPCTLPSVLCVVAFGALGLGALLFRPPHFRCPPLFFSFLCPLFAPPFSRRFRCFRPWVPWALALCLPSLSLASFFFFFLFFPPLLFCPPAFSGSGRSWCFWPLVRLAGFLFPSLCAAVRVVRALCAGAAVCVVSCWSCPVASFALAGAVCCCLWLRGGRCWVWLPAVVFRWRASARVVLPGRLSRRPAVCFGLLWPPAPPCCVLFAVALCCRVAACCGALLSFLLSFVVGVALCCSLAPSVVRCAFLWVVFCAPFVCPRLFVAASGCLLAVLFRSRWLVLCVVACGCRLFVAGSGCLLLFSSGVCCLGCSCLAAWLAALLCAVGGCGDAFPWGPGHGTLR